MKETEKTEAETESQRLARLWLKCQRAIVQVQLFEGIAQVVIVVGVGRVETGEYHRFHRLVAGQWLRRRRIGGERDGVADVQVLHALEAGGDIADLAGCQARRLNGRGGENADLDWVDACVAGHGEEAGGRVNAAVDHAHVGHNALVWVVMAVENQRLQLFARVPLRRRHLHNDLFQHLFDVEVVLGANAENVGCGHGQKVFNVLGDLIRQGRRQIDLVEDRNDGQVKFHGRQKMCDRLRLNALGSVDDQDGALAGLERALDFVGEVDVPGRVDEIHLIVCGGFAGAVAAIDHSHGAGFDGNASLPLQIHRVEELLLHLAVGNCAGALDQAVGQRTLAVIDMSDYAEVSNVVEIHWLAGIQLPISCGRHLGDSILHLGLVELWPR